MRKKRRRSLILKIAVFAFVVYIAVTLIHTQVLVSRSRAELAETTAKLMQQQSENAEIQREISEDDGTYKESIARDKLGYAKPDERVFINASGN